MPFNPKDFQSMCLKEAAVTGYSDVPAVMMDSQHNGLIYSNMEYLCDIAPPNDNNTILDNDDWYTGQDASFMSLKVYPLNPAVSRTCPQGSQIAMNYTEYKWISIEFIYRPLIGDVILTNSTTGQQSGQVVMSTMMDARNPVWPSRAQMLQQRGSTSGKPSYAMVHKVDCRYDTLRRPYIRNNTKFKDNDIRLSDLGYFGICGFLPQFEAGSYSGATDWGELYIRYSFECWKPRLWATIGANTRMWNIHFNQPLFNLDFPNGNRNLGNGEWGSTTTMSGFFCPPTKYLTVSNDSNIDIDYSQLYARSLEIPTITFKDPTIVGNFVITLEVVGTTANNVVPPQFKIGYPETASVLNIYNFGATNIFPYNTVVGSTSNNLAVSYAYTFNGARMSQSPYQGNPLQFGFQSWTYPANQTNFSLTIQQLPFYYSAYG